MSKNIDKKLLEIGFKKKIKNENLYEYVRENEESKYIHKVDIAKKLISNMFYILIRRFLIEILLLGLPSMK